uniref:ADF-H domain-containing protein n=1 Tax=Panagrolaimus sp. JU765 TaxID=591449 RepID=A0AC34PUA2_9BILA
MSGSLTICTIPDELKQKLKDFRFKKSSSTNVIILKIDRADQIMKIESEMEDCSLEELQSELPNQQPRFIVLNYLLKHPDCRVSYPMCLLFYGPSGCSTELQILYAGSRNHLVKECEFTKCLEIRDPEDITEDYLNSKLL